MVPSGWRRAVAVVALGGATLALGGVAAERAAAQQTPQPTAPGAGGQARHEQFLAAVAAKLNVTPERLRQAMDEARQELGLPERSAKPGGPGGPGGGPGRGGFGMGLEAAAQALGISVDQLRQELPGKSLADVARAHNVDPTTVANALKSEATARIDQALGAGRITADQATQMKQGLNDRIDQQVNRTVPPAAAQRVGRRP
jgi:hypothetical protein